MPKRSVWRGDLVLSMPHYVFCGLAIFERYELSFIRTGVDLSRSADSLVVRGVHFLPVGDPTWQTADSEHYRKHRTWNSNSSVNHTRVKVDIGVQFPLNKVLVL